MKDTQKKNAEEIRKIMKLSSPIQRSIMGIEPTIDKVSVGKEVSLANRKRYKAKKYETEIFNKLSVPLTVRYDSGDLIVITRTKQLVSYILTITDKSPKKYRFSIISKLHLACIESLECMFKANAISLKGKNYDVRSNYQLEAYSKLKLISYFSLLACENACILRKQFEHISLLVSDSINLLFAWRKADQQTMDK